MTTTTTETTIKAVDRVLGSGRRLEITIDNAIATVWVDGESIGRKATAIRLATPVGEITHYIPTEPAVGVTSSEASHIMATIRTQRSSRRRHEIIGHCEPCPHCGTYCEGDCQAN